MKDCQSARFICSSPWHEGLPVFICLSPGPKPYTAAVRVSGQESTPFSPMHNCEANSEFANKVDNLPDLLINRTRSICGLKQCDRLML